MSQYSNIICSILFVLSLERFSIPEWNGGKFGSKNQYLIDGITEGFPLNDEPSDFEMWTAAFPAIGPFEAADGRLPSKHDGGSICGSARSLSWGAGGCAEQWVPGVPWYPENPAAASTSSFNERKTLWVYLRDVSNRDPQLAGKDEIGELLCKTIPSAVLQMVIEKQPKRETSIFHGSFHYVITWTDFSWLYPHFKWVKWWIPQLSPISV